MRQRLCSQASCLAVPPGRRWRGVSGSLCRPPSAHEHTALNRPGYHGQDRAAPTRMPVKNNPAPFGKRVPFFDAPLPWSVAQRRLAGSVARLADYVACAETWSPTKRGWRIVKRVPIQESSAGAPSAKFRSQSPALHIPSRFPIATKD